MTLVSFDDIENGEAATADVWNARYAAILAAVNGNLDSNNLADNAVIASKIAAGAVTNGKLAANAVTNAKLSTDTGELGAAWQTWTPTRANLTIGSGTEIAVYYRIGKTIGGFYKFILGVGSAIGTQPTVTPPVAAHARYATGNNIIGSSWAEDAGSGNYMGTVVMASSGTAMSPGVTNTGFTYAGFGAYTASIPFNWGSGDYFSFIFEYEAA
jgi:hypothetical protein